jgi:hypothetical protein
MSSTVHYTHTYINSTYIHACMQIPFNRCTFGVIGTEQASKQARAAESRGQMEQWFADGAYALVGTYGGLQGTEGHTAVILITADSQVTPVKRELCYCNCSKAGPCCYYMCVAADPQVTPGKFVVQVTPDKFVVQVTPGKFVIIMVTLVKRYHVSVLLLSSYHGKQIRYVGDSGLWNAY